ncbi:MAG: lactonase family protein [Acidobacteria bacterium]|nr:lactonase family protein [Acidobacteriota bacterium]MCA1610503.1 lactonase family protein [Acidobacteriota bacterium]
MSPSITGMAAPGAPHRTAVTPLRPLLARMLKGLAVALLPALFAAQPALADNEKTTSVVYVESNKAENNSILAYRRDANGNLTRLGEYPTRGKGVFDLSLQLGPFDSDQDIITNPERTLLFAVNSGSDTVAVFRILPDGSLVHVAGSPFASGGTNPVSVGLARDTLIVVNKAMDPRRPSLTQPNYASFRVEPDGTLTALLSTVGAPPRSSPTQADISPSKRLVFDAQFLGGHLQSFLLDPAGALLPNAPEGLPASESERGTAPLPLGLWAHPKQSILYVGFVTVNKVGVYTYDFLGGLTFVRSVPNSGVAVCWLRTNDDGTRLYTSNTGDGTVSVFDTTDPLTPVEIQKHKLRGVGNPFQLELDPTGAYLYVLTQRADSSIPLGEGNTLHVLKVNRANGKLSEAGSSPIELPVPTGTRPQGIAVTQLVGGQ